MSNYVVVIRSTPEHDFHVLPVAEEIDKKRRKQKTIVKHFIIVLAVLYKVISKLHRGSLW
jgi:hypothetical protein